MTREMLETFVFAYNTPLKEAVKTMDPVILLRNCHPTYRSVFASLLLDEGYITREMAKEFIILIGK